MKLKSISIALALSLALAAPLPIAAQQAPAAIVESEGDEEEVDDEGEAPEESVSEEGGEEEAQLAERINPLIDIDLSGSDIDIAVPSFIKRDLNHVMLNGADWSALRRAAARSGVKPLSIVHIGDSHVQADMATAVTRELLQYDLGDAGRGLVTPLRLAGTNQPGNYSFTSPDGWTAVKLMSKQWTRPMGFTGVSVHPNKLQTSVTIATRPDADDFSPFTSVTLFHGGKMSIAGVNDAATGKPVKYRTIPSRDYTQILLSEPVDGVTIYFSSKGDLTLYGASLSGQRPGVFYHAIGNNGAAYATYNRIGNVGAGLQPLEPDLIVVSLGTNEAFGRFDPQTFTASVDRLVKNIRSCNPDAQLLLVTPMECQKSVSKKTSKRVPVKGKKGKKGKRRKSYKTVSSTTRSYARNESVARVRDAILEYGRANNIAVLDWYAVAGGQGASDTWIREGLFSKDRVHHSGKGYRLQGRLIYDALIDVLARNN